MNLWDVAIGVNYLVIKSACLRLEKQKGEKTDEEKNTYIYFCHCNTIINA